MKWNGRPLGWKIEMPGGLISFDRARLAGSYARLELPIKYLSMEIAALRPSEMAHTTRD